MNKKYWKKKSVIVYITKSLSKRENKDSLRKYMWRHQLLDVEEKAKVVSGWNMQEWHPETWEFYSGGDLQL